MGRSRCTIFDGPPLSRIFELGACRWHGIVLGGSVERSAVVSVRLSGGCKSLHDLVDAGFKFGDRQRFLKKRKWAWVLKHRLIMIDKRLLKESQSRGALLRAFYYTAVIQDPEFTSIRPLIDGLDYNSYTVVTKATKEYL